MKFKNILLLSAALLIISCSSTKAPESARNDLIQNGFLLSLPEEDKWTVVKKGDYKVLLSKQGANGRDRYTIQALVVSLPAFENDNQFLEFIENRTAKSRKNTNVIEHNSKFFTADNGICVQHTSKEKRNSKNSTASILEVVSFTCRHPENTNAGVYLALSKSYTSGTSDEILIERAIKLFKHLYFTEL